MTEATVRIGDAWARRISLAFQHWASQEQPERTFSIKPFDPTPYIELAFYEAGEAQIAQIGKLIGIGVKFDLRSPEAEAWIRNFGAQEIRYIDAATQKTIRQITLRAFQEGLTARERSKLIKQYIGLLPQHAVAVANYRQALEGIDSALADRLEEKYRQKLLKWRADTIALSEAHAAANQGYREANAGAVRRGILSPVEWERYWMVTRDKRTCPTCESLSGDRADLPGGAFERGGRGPPKHPRCRCTEGLRPYSGKI